MIRVRMLAAVAVLAAVTPVLAQAHGTVAKTIVTVDGPQSNISADSVSVSVNGGKGQVTGFRALRGDGAGLQLLILIDNSARRSFSLQYEDVRRFIMALPPSVQIGVAYMQNGNAQFGQEFTADHAAAAGALRIPNGTAGSNGSPYFVLSDLLKRWGPEHTSSGAPHPGAVRREVLMFTNGVEAYDSGRFDPNNPYVQTAIKDAQRAGVIVYAIYVRDVGNAGFAEAEADNGQNYLVQLTDATGGKTYYTGTSTSPNFQPYLEDVRKRLDNQYELTFTTDSKRSPFGFKVKAQGAKLSAPAQAYAQ